MKIVLGSYDYPPDEYHYQWIDDSWIISDIAPRHPNIERIDARAIPYNNVEALYASHVLEHISEKDVLKTLKHWYKVLKKGGWVHINVPDMEWFLDNWIRLNNDQESLSPYYDTKKSMLYILDGDSSTVYDTHKSWFMETKLRNLMKKAGFRKVEVEKVYEAHDMGCLIAEGYK